MSSSLNPIPHKTRRHHSEAFKSQVIQQCKHDRASGAGVALRHNVNANIVHRWLPEHERHGLHSNPAFVPVAIDYPITPTLPVPAAAVNQHTDSVLLQNHNDIRVEIQRGQCAITLHWPTQASAACSAWDGIGVWLAARSLHQGHFVWPIADSAKQLTISRVQFDALVLGLPWHRLGEAGINKIL